MFNTGDKETENRLDEIWKNIERDKINVDDITYLGSMVGELPSDNSKNLNPILTKEESVLSVDFVLTVVIPTCILILLAVLSFVELSKQLHNRVAARSAREAATAEKAAREAAKAEQAAREADELKPATG